MEREPRRLLHHQTPRLAATSSSSCSAGKSSLQTAFSPTFHPLLFLLPPFIYIYIFKPHLSRLWTSDCCPILWLREVTPKQRIKTCWRGFCQSTVTPSPHRTLPPTGDHPKTWKVPSAPSALQIWRRRPNLLWNWICLEPSGALLERRGSEPKVCGHPVVLPRQNPEFAS